MRIDSKYQTQDICLENHALSKDLSYENITDILGIVYKKITKRTRENPLRFYESFAMRIQSAYN